VKLLFIGDIVGAPGRRAVQVLVPRLRGQWGLDLVIANAENSAGGSGITPGTASEILESGVDVLTSGDHLWDQKEITQVLGFEPRLVRPMNYPPGTPGAGVYYWERARDGLQVAVANVQARTFMPDLDNPFRALQAEIPKMKERAKIIFIDAHGEATSEKIAMARMLDGQASAVVGTHTHVQTADEQIFPGGTAFLCDAGFTGPHESILGREITPVIERFLTNQPRRFPVATQRILLQGALIEIDEATGRALSIQRVSEPLPLEAKSTVKGD